MAPLVARLRRYLAHPRTLDRQQCHDGAALIGLGAATALAKRA